MQVDTLAPPPSRTLYWIGWILSVLPAGMLMMSGVMKILKPEAVIKGMSDLGWSEDLALGLAMIEIGCTVIFLLPQTCVLGAILLTGYLGGAIATHARIGDNFLGPLVLGVVIWLGIYLREPRLRGLVPWRG